MRKSRTGGKAKRLRRHDRLWRKAVRAEERSDRAKELFYSIDWAAP